MSHASASNTKNQGDFLQKPWQKKEKKENGVGQAKNNWIKKQKYKLLRLGLAEAGREARGEGEQVRD